MNENTRAKNTCQIKQFSPPNPSAYYLLMPKNLIIDQFIIYTFIYSFTLPPSIHLFILFIYSSFSSIHLFIHLFIYLFLHLFIHSSTHPSFHSSIHSSTHPSFHLTTHLTTRLSYHSSTHSSTHPSLN